MEQEVAVEPQEKIAEVLEPQQVPEIEQVDEETTHVEQEPQKQVPLSALQKERKKRQELELELQWERNRQQTPPPSPKEEDNSKYESATREDLSNAQEEAIRVIEERLWIKQNPEKYEKVNEYLPQFLKQRPNLAPAINLASNRYEEAYTLMEALTQKQKQQLRPVASAKKETPGAPTNIPKAAAMNQTVDVMSMSDSEFSQWRQSQKKRR